LKNIVYDNINTIQSTLYATLALVAAICANSVLAIAYIAALKDKTKKTLERVPEGYHRG
jgi:hypothetical protein